MLVKYQVSAICPTVPINYPRRPSQRKNTRSYRSQFYPKNHVLLHVHTAISTPRISARTPVLFELLRRGNKRISLIANIFFFFFFLVFQCQRARKNRGKGPVPSPPPFTCLLLSSVSKEIGNKKRRKERTKSEEEEPRQREGRAKKEQKREKEICIFDETEEDSSYVSLSDCQASTLMRRGVISETVYWLDP